MCCVKDLLQVRGSGPYCYYAYRYNRYLFHDRDLPYQGIKEVLEGENLIISAAQEQRAATVITETAASEGSVSEGLERQIRHNEATRIEMITNTSLLIDLLELYESCPSLPTLSLTNRIMTDPVERARFKDGVITMCMKYGMSTHSHGVYADACSIAYGLRNIYRLYCFWIFRYFGEEFIQEPFRSLLDVSEYEDVNDGDKAICCFSGVDVHRGVSVQDGKMTALSILDSLFDIALVQMQDIILAGELGLDGRSATHCKECGAAFIKEHGNASLCARCGTNSAKLRRFRARQKEKKEAANHTQESQR